MTQRALSLAAIRRIAHDARRRLTKSGYDSALEDLEEFLSRTLRLSAQAAEFSRRKVISQEHVAYAVESLGLALPRELRGTLAEDFKQFKRCNIRAPADQRKQNALYAEIPEAAFSRFLRAVAARAHIAARVKATARRFLQLVAEQRVLAHFSQSPQLPESATDAATARALAEVLGCSAIDADARALFLTQLFNRVPLLLCLSRSQTLSDRLVRAAAADLSCPTSLVAPANETLLVRVCLRILRGRAPHQRVTKAAATELAALLRRCSALPASPEAEGAAEPEPLEEEAKGPAGPEAFEGKAP